MFFFIPLTTFSQKMEFKEISSLEGLSHNTVYAITQDDHGFIWFGTREGLNRFDGYKIKTYYSGKNEKGGLPNDQINALLSTDQGLLIGTPTGLFRYLPDQDKFVSAFAGKRIKEAVNNIKRGTKNLIFIGTSEGLYTLDQKNNIKKILENVVVKSFNPYKKDVYWVALNRRVLLINDLGDVIKEYKIIPGTSKRGASLITHTIFKDSENRTWLGTSRGLFVFDKAQDEFIYSPLKHEIAAEADVIRAIAEDKKGDLWFGTETGLFIIEKCSGQTRHYSHSFADNSGSLSDKSIYSILIGRQGLAWIGTYFGGVNYASLDSNGFRKMVPGEDNHSLNGKAVSQMIKDQEGKLWIGTEDGGITIFDKSKNSFSFLNTEQGLSSNNIHALLEDKKSNIWIGTFLGGLNVVDRESEKIEVYKHDPDDSLSLSNNNVYSILEDPNGKIWIGTQFGLNIFDQEDQEFSLFKPEILGNKFVYDLLQASNGDIWICTRFTGIFRYNPGEHKLQHFSIASGVGMTSDFIISANEDSRGNIWFGTLNGGALKWDSKTEEFSHLNKNNGLLNNNVYGILEGTDKSLWLSTNKGLTRYFPKEQKMSTYTSDHGLATNQFNFKSSLKDEEGWMYFGSVKGLTFFHPDSLVLTRQAPSIEFTSFQLFNKEVPVEKNGVLTKQIAYTDSVELQYHQNVVSIEFAAMNFRPGNNYAYFLEGFDSDWHKVGDKRTATYTNLAPGEYVFKVKTLPLANQNEKELHLTILPPFWKTDLAYGSYLLLLLFLLYVSLRFSRFIQKQRLAVQMEKIEREKMGELNQHRLNFFTFISHEFKTPLTLIIASIDKFFQQNSPALPHCAELAAVKKNAGRLQHLIHQLMEFRKTETEHGLPSYKRGDIMLFLKDTVQAYKLLVQEKQLSFSYKNDLPEYFCYFDPDKIEMIVTNLISNAIKNTPEGGEIEISTLISPTLDETNRSQLKLIVEDSGSGINKADLENIFNPFFKSGNRKSSQWQSGTGIGLALVHNLVHLLQGEILVESETTRGTKITVAVPCLLKMDNAVQEIEVEGNKDLRVNPDIIVDLPLTPDPKEESQEKDSRNLSILLVEDNREILRFLQKHFGRKFKIQCARSGSEALRKLEKNIPDIIISDLVMAEMDGISLCKKVRSNARTHHVPFLLLTGKNEDSYRMEGLRVGANAYIPKPFSIGELDLIVNNILYTTHSRNKRFSEVKVDSLPNFPKNNQNEEFLKKIQDLVQDNLSDSDFNVEDLAKKMGISRSLLHLKMKKATGGSASEFLKKTRLQKATALIHEGKAVSEVAYKVGFNDPNYFSRVFKKEYKVSPTSYKESGQLKS